MHCADAGRLMDEVLDGRANSDRKAALLAHVTDCVACRAEWSAIQRVDQLLAAAPQVSPPADFSAQVIARLSHTQPARNPWAGALALFAGTLVFLSFAVLSFLGVTLSVNSPGLLEIGGVGLLQIGDAFVGWMQAGWGIRQAILSLVPPGLVVLYALLALTALAIWLGLVAGLQGVLRPAGATET